MSELLYKCQAGSACVQMVHSVVFGKYCIVGSRSSMITDTKFGEDIPTDIEGEERRNKLPAPPRLRTGRVKSGSLAIKTLTRFHVLSCSSADLGVEFCASCPLQRAGVKTRNVSRQTASRPIEHYADHTEVQ